MPRTHHKETEEEVLRQYWKDQAREALLEDENENLIQKYFSYKHFVSYSNGFGRKKRRGRDVELLTIRHSGRAVAIKDVPTGRMDIYAREALAGSVDTDDHFQFVVDYFRTHFRKDR